MRCYGVLKQWVKLGQVMTCLLFDAGLFMYQRRLFTCVFVQWLLNSSHDIELPGHDIFTNYLTIVPEVQMCSGLFYHILVVRKQNEMFHKVVLRWKFFSEKDSEVPDIPEGGTRFMPFRYIPKPFPRRVPYIIYRRYIFAILSISNNTFK